jgi:DNA-binding IclR family transcriptional regulator
MLTSSMGRAYLAMLPEAERAALIGELVQGAGKGRRAAVLVASALHEIEAFEKARCCFSFRDWHEDVNAVAVPFRDPRDGRWLVLSCSGPASSMGEDVFRERIAPRLKALARRLGQAR